MKRLLTSAFLLLTVAVSHAADRGLPALEGITNFGRINAHLYRGAQPSDTAIQNLKKLGVTTIISLRVTNNAEAKIEAAAARENGITYTNTPLAGVGRPTDAEVARILAIIENSPGPVFVHCEHGCDRTGTIIACYRIQHDHWTAAAALSEAEMFGISRLERGMRRYIADFARSKGQTVTNAPLPSP